MDGDFVYGLEEVVRNIDSAEVMSLFFPTFRRALVIDTRSNGREGPMIRVMPMVASPQERLRSIRKLRPGFPRLHNLTLVPWPRFVDSLVTTGVWDRIVRRLVRAGHYEAAAACDMVLEELRRLERAELAAAVKGENYYTVWSSHAR